MNWNDLVPEDVAKAQDKWELGRLLERGAKMGRPRTKTCAQLGVLYTNAKWLGGAYLQNELSPVEVYQRSLADVLAIHEHGRPPVKPEPHKLYKAHSRLT